MARFCVLDPRDGTIEKSLVKFPTTLYPWVLFLYRDQQNILVKMLSSSRGMEPSLVEAEPAGQGRADGAKSFPTHLFPAVQPKFNPHPVKAYGEEQC